VREGWLGIKGEEGEARVGMREWGGLEVGDRWLRMREGHGGSGWMEKSESQSLNSSLESRAMLGRLMASGTASLPPDDPSPAGDTLITIPPVPACDCDCPVTDCVLRVELRNNPSDPWLSDRLPWYAPRGVGGAKGSSE